MPSRQYPLVFDQPWQPQGISPLMILYLSTLNYRFTKKGPLSGDNFSWSYIICFCRHYRTISLAELRPSAKQHDKPIPQRSPNSSIQRTIALHLYWNCSALLLVQDGCTTHFNQQLDTRYGVMLVARTFQFVFASQALTQMFPIRNKFHDISSMPRETSIDTSTSFQLAGGQYLARPINSVCFAS
jgi:hypothetical protein